MNRYTGALGTTTTTTTTTTTQQYEIQFSGQVHWQRLGNDPSNPAISPCSSGGGLFVQSNLPDTTLT
jgi:hypothetical protein